MAAQVYKQILLADPNNVEAIIGLAEYYKVSGNNAEAEKYLQQLRVLSPGNPNVSRIQELSKGSERYNRLAEAGRLAQAGQSDAAMDIYRSMYGSNPPDGDLALAFYETEYGTNNGKGHALEGLRGLVKRHPGEQRYAIALGRVLTYSPKTRAEGIRLLGQYPQNAIAQSSLRQALLWDAQNPNSIGSMREYLKQHPDEELAEKLHSTESVALQRQNALAVSEGEREGYRLLSQGKTDLAQQKFQGIIEKQPENARAYAGLGFVYMKRGSFSDAVDSFEKAQKHGLKIAAVDTALTQSHFWLLMNEGARAFTQSEYDKAGEKYREALKIVPTSPEALEGLAGVLMTKQQYLQAIDTYQQAIKLQPKSVSLWRGFVTAETLSGNPKDAIAKLNQAPKAVQDELMNDPGYLSSLSTAYRKAGQNAEADRVLERAMKLPIPEGAKGVGVRLQYASLMMANNRYEEAVNLYRQILADDNENKDAWQGLISALHQSNQDEDAIAAFEGMPSDAHENVLNDPSFLVVLAAVYQKQNRFDVAQGFLERGIHLKSAAGNQPLVALRLQLASLDLSAGKVDEAADVYRQILVLDPSNADAWKGLLAALQKGGRDQEALDQLAHTPYALRSSLDQDLEYQQTVAGIYSKNGQSVSALKALAKVQGQYAARHVNPPASVDLQTAWLLYDTRNDRGLYIILMRVGSRSDLTPNEREQTQRLWASWSVRRAGQEVDAGNSQKAVEILDAAADQLPDDPFISKTIAGGYARAGKANEALKIYSNQKWENASVADYQGAIGAAMSANDYKQAEIWLLQALHQYPNDYKIFALAAQLERAQGNESRAAAYWRASLAAVPPAEASNSLAEELATPAPKEKKHLPEPLDLPLLLNPHADDPQEKEEKPLPGYKDLKSAAEVERESLVLSDNRNPSDIYTKVDAPMQFGRVRRIDWVSLAKKPRLVYMQYSPSATKSESAPSSAAGKQQTPASSAPPVWIYPEQNVLTVRQRMNQRPPTTNARQQAQEQLNILEGSHSGWGGANAYAIHRSGVDGYDRLTGFEAPTEASFPLGPTARITVIATPVFLDSGTVSGDSTITVVTSNSNSKTENITQPLGTLVTMSNSQLPEEQSAWGLGGEVQLVTHSFGAAVGYTPYEFPVANLIGRLQYRPVDSPITFSISRESVKDTQLSYAGLHDPGSMTTNNSGNIWGGVVANAGNVQFNQGNANYGYYAGVGGQYLTGRNVLTNRRFHGNAGAYWSVYSRPDSGYLNIGVNFFGMGYSYNLRAMTWGMGGYFSPQTYILGNAPITWHGHYRKNLNYNITSSLGVQGFREDKSLLFPSIKNSTTTATYRNYALPARSSVGGNYDLRAEVSRMLNNHWYFGGFANLNNSRNYNSQTAGFFVRYMFHKQPLLEDGRTGIFPHDGFRPLLVP